MRNKRKKIVKGFRRLQKFAKEYEVVSPEELIFGSRGKQVHVRRQLRRRV